MVCPRFSKTTFRKIAIWTIVLSMHLMVSLPILTADRTAYAAKFVDGVWTQSASPGTTTVTFTNTTQLLSGEEIIITFPSTATINGAGTDLTITSQTSPTRTNNATDNTITVTLDATITASTAITMTFTDGLTAYTTTTYAQESLGINTTDSGGSPYDYGIALMTNDNTTDVTATVPLFVTMAVDDVTMDLGTLSTASVSSATQIYTINSNNTSGITMQIAADGDLDDSGSNTINAVSDGTVTAGSEEYGITVTTSGLTVDATYVSGDNEIVQAADDVASSAAAISAATLTVLYEASIAGTTVAGSYNQVVTMTIATNA